jgi:L-2,4-diaminobutyrate decarboxylase
MITGHAVVPASDVDDVGVWRKKPDDVVTWPDPVGADAALASDPQGGGGLAELLSVALAALAGGRSARGGPLPSGGAPVVAAAMRAALSENVLPEFGIGAASALAELTQVLAYGAADPADARCVGHLHCPPLAVAAVADFAVSVLNPSLDSWDQAPAGTALEGEVLAALAGLVGYPPASAGGVLTTGGTESNLMGLLLARDTVVHRRYGAHPAATGLPAGAVGRLRVLCSELAHFSVAREAALLGLGEHAVIRVATDRDRRMDPVMLGEALSRVAARGEVPVAVVATAGTTDFGSIDPLPQVAEAAVEHGAWLHVDAAYGGGALFSDRLAPLLRGLELADSLALDLHKLGWQPVAAGVFLTREAAALKPLEQRVAYLNPADDEEAGYPSLLGRSLRTTRRADAFKIAVTLRALGRAGIGTLVDRCHDLAGYAARAIDEHPQLFLEAPPVLTSVVFAYSARTDADRVNAALRRRLLVEGHAVVGRTELGHSRPDGMAGDGRVRLKLTFLNPTATPADVDALLKAIVLAGQEEDVC